MVTVPVTDPLVVYYENPAELARYADPTATGRNATRWNPATDATIEVRYAATTPTWQQLRLTVTVPTARRCRSAPTGPAPATTSPLASLAGRWRSSKPQPPGQYQVSAARAVEPGATLAVGDNFVRNIAMTALGAATLALVTVVAAAVLLAVVTYRARSRTTR